MKLKINNSEFDVKAVISQKDISTGMMRKKFNSELDGMLFMMSEGQHCFWMKNCITHLDIIFIENNLITQIHHNCPPCKTKNCRNYCGEGDLVLELSGGICKKLGIKSGDKIICNLD